MKKLFVIAALSMCMIAPVFAYTSPGKPTGHVNDFAHILSSGTVSQLENSLASFEQRETDEIAVVTVPSLGDETIETYAVALFKEWGIGKKDKNNGVLLLVAPNERKVRIEVGYGLEGALTDAQSALIIQNDMLPHFKQNDFDGGVTAGVNDIISAIHGEYQAAATASTAATNKTTGHLIIALLTRGWIVIFVILQLGVFFLKWMARSKAIWPGALIGGFLGFWATGIGFSVNNEFATLSHVVPWFLGATAGGALLGLILDALLSRATGLHAWADQKNISTLPRWMGGGPRSGGGGGGFGGFGGGSSGGGGASGGW